MKSASAKMQLTAVLVLAIVVGSTKAEEEKDQRQERFFAYYFTTSVTILTTTTVTGLATCLSTAQTFVPGAFVPPMAPMPPIPRGPDCQGRKKRMISRSTELDLAEKEGVIELDGSLGETSEVHEMEKRDVSSRSGKRLTIWSTNFSFITITSTSIVPLTTITVKAVCFFPGNVQTCF